MPFPDLMPSALAVMEAVQDMANIAQKIVFESVDEVSPWQGSQIIMGADASFDYPSVTNFAGTNFYYFCKLIASKTHKNSVVLPTTK